MHRSSRRRSVAASIDTVGSSSTSSTGARRDEAAGDGDPLPLATGEVAAAEPRPEHGVEPVGQRRPRSRRHRLGRGPAADGIVVVETARGRRRRPTHARAARSGRSPGRRSCTGRTTPSGSRSPIGVPSIAITPPVDAAHPSSRFTSVVLPAPFSPTSAVTLPAGRSRSTGPSASSAALRVPEASPGRSAMPRSAPRARVSAAARPLAGHRSAPDDLVEMAGDVGRRSAAGRPRRRRSRPRNTSWEVAMARRNSDGPDRVVGGRVAAEDDHQHDRRARRSRPPTRAAAPPAPRVAADDERGGRRRPTSRRGGRSGRRRGRAPGAPCPRPGRCRRRRGAGPPDAARRPRAPLGSWPPRCGGTRPRPGSSSNGSAASHGSTAANSNAVTTAVAISADQPSHEGERVHQRLATDPEDLQPVDDVAVVEQIERRDRAETVEQDPVDLGRGHLHESQQAVGGLPVARSRWPRRAGRARPRARPRDPPTRVGALRRRGSPVRPRR